MQDKCYQANEANKYEDQKECEKNKNHYWKTCNKQDCANKLNLSGGGKISMKNNECQSKNNTILKNLEEKESCPLDNSHRCCMKGNHWTGQICPPTNVDTSDETIQENMCKWNSNENSCDSVKLPTFCMKISLLKVPE